MKTSKFKVIYKDLNHRNVNGFRIVDSTSAQSAVNEVRKQLESEKSNSGLPLNYHVITVLQYCENWY